MKIHFISHDKPTKTQIHLISVISLSVLLTICLIFSLAYVLDQYQAMAQTEGEDGVNDAKQEEEENDVSDASQEEEENDVSDASQEEEENDVSDVSEEESQHRIILEPEDENDENDVSDVNQEEEVEEEEQTGEPITLGPIDLGGVFGSIIDNIAKNLNNLLNSKTIDKLSDSECLNDGLTGGPSEIKKKGHLIIGTPCSDKIKGDSDDEIIYTLGGVDRVFAGMGNDIIYGGLGDNRLYGERDDDIIMPGGGANLVDGGPGNDVLFGGVGNNLLLGGDGNDQLIAGIGTTIMDGGSGSNSFDCGPSSMVLDYNPDNGDTIAGKCKIVNNVGIDFPSDIDFLSEDD